MSKKADGTKPKTSIAISYTTLERLRGNMKYGDTINEMIDKLLDFYDKWKGVVDNVKFQDGDKLE